MKHVSLQIFDKEGRFKFQFGECGKRDGQLLYPNRVAVMKNSGDIIVTERSPTHQVQREFSVLYPNLKILTATLLHLISSNEFKKLTRGSVLLGCYIFGWCSKNDSQGVRLEYNSPLELQFKFK